MATISRPDRKITVYEPTTGGMPAVGPYLEEIWERRALVWHLARTDMKAKHFDTILGKAWLVVDPIVMAATFYLVRVVFQSGAKADAGFFMAHLIMGISFFFYVRAIVEGGSRCILGNKSLVLNTSAPRGVFPAVVLVRAVLELIPAMFVYFAVHWITGQPWGLSLVLLPVVVALLTIFALGLGLLFAPFVVFYRDTGTLLPYVIRIWLYITPVMYAVGEIPPGVKPILVLNPLYPYFYMLEEIFKANWPSPTYFLWAGAWSAAALVVGMFLFMRRERDYAVRL